MFYITSKTKDEGKTYISSLQLTYPLLRRPRRFQRKWELPISKWFACLIDTLAKALACGQFLFPKHLRNRNECIRTSWTQTTLARIREYITSKRRQIWNRFRNEPVTLIHLQSNFYTTIYTHLKSLVCFTVMIFWVTRLWFLMGNWWLVILFLFTNIL